MLYGWQQELLDVCPAVSEEIQHYYHYLQQTAEACLARLDAASFKEVFPQLNGIGERCSLLFYFLSEPAMNPFDTSESLIDYIERDYCRTYQERFDGWGLYQKQSLICAVKEPNKSLTVSCLWEEDLCTLLAQHMESNCQEIEAAYQQLLRYFQQLRIAGNACIARIVGNNFDILYPELLAIETKCWLLLDSIPFMLTEPADQESLIALIEGEYTLVYHELVKEELV